MYPPLGGIEYVLSHNVLLWLCVICCQEYISLFSQFNIVWYNRNRIIFTMRRTKQTLAFLVIFESFLEFLKSSFLVSMKQPCRNLEANFMLALYYKWYKMVMTGMCICYPGGTVRQGNTQFHYFKFSFLSHSFLNELT